MASPSSRYMSGESLPLVIWFNNPSKILLVFSNGKFPSVKSAACFSSVGFVLITSESNVTIKGFGIFILPMRSIPATLTLLSLPVSAIWIACPINWSCIEARAFSASTLTSAFLSFLRSANKIVFPCFMPSLLTALTALNRTVVSLLFSRRINATPVLFFTTEISLWIAPLKRPSTLSSTEGFAQVLNASIASARIFGGLLSFDE